MRKHKFKAWDQDHKQMINWEQYKYEMVSNDLFDDLGLLKIMQWTGLKDKKGVDIYEGDIIKTESGLITDVRYVVNSFKYCAAIKKTYRGEYYIENISFDLPINSSDQRWGVEVIGNIFENPELIKEE